MLAGTESDCNAMQTMAELIRCHGSTRPDAPALLIDDRTLTFGEIDIRSNRLSQALSAVGVGVGSRVALLDTNSPQFFELLFAVSKLGAVLVGINWRLAAAEIAGIINDSGAQVLLVGAEFEQLIDSISSELPTLNTVAVIGSADNLVGSDGNSGSGNLRYEEWLVGCEDLDPCVPTPPDDVVLQLYTSGTTGLPKGVMLPNSSIFAFASSGAELLGLNSPDVVNLAPLPLFHIGGAGWALISFFSGLPTVLIPKVDPRSLLELVELHGVTHMFVVPALLAAMPAIDNVDEIDLSSLRTVLYGASPITESVLLPAMELLGCEFGQLYGMTESTGTITMLDHAGHNPEGTSRHRLRSAGKPVATNELRIVDPDLVDVEVGVIGEILVRSEQLMAGYWGQPGATAAALPDGWLRTGDAGSLDGDGYLFIHDRVNDLIITGGENVYPAEVENVLMGHASVSDVAVVGVPDPKWGETVKAIVVASAGDPLESELIEYARKRIAHYKCPTSVAFVGELPRNASGKVLRRELREQFC